MKLFKIKHQIILTLICVFSIYTTILSQVSIATIRYQSSIRGGLTFAANGLVSSANVFVNSAGGTTMSSSSDLVLPAGSTIVKAFLYVESFYGTAGTAISSVKFRVPGGAYTTLNSASPGFIASRLDAGGSQYAIYVHDVTAMLPANGYVTNAVVGGEASGVGRYSVADVVPTQVTNNGYGWSLVVVYSNPNSKYRNITVADGCSQFGLDTFVTPSRMTLDIPNVVVPSTGTVNAVALITGSWGETGATLTDVVEFGRNTGALTALRDPASGSTTDVQNGSIGMAVPNNVTADGATGIVNGAYRAKNPDNTFTNPSTLNSSFYYDCDILNASGILPASATPVTVRILQRGTTSDALGAGAYGISVDIAPAKLTKSIAPPTIPCGGTATYTFTITNDEVGAVLQNGLGFTDNIPSGLMIASPNGVVRTGGTGTPVITATPGSNTFSISGLNLAANQTCTITLNVTNKAGQSNASCGGNPAAFTNGPTNITSNTSNLGNGVTPQCLVVSPPTAPTFTPIPNFCPGTATPTLPTTSLEGVAGSWAPAFNATTTTTYTFTPTDLSCATTTTMTITVLPKPTPTFAPISICSNDPVPTLPPSSIEGIAGTWATLPVSNTATGTYTFTPSGGVCANTTTHVVTVNPTVVPTFAALSNVCVGGTAPTLVSPSTNGVAGTWSPAAFTTTAAGNFTSTFTPTSGVCTSTVSINFTVDPQTVPTFTALTAVCVNGAAPTLQTTSNNGVNGTWTPGSFSTATAGTFNATFNPTSGTCPTTATISFTVNPPTVPTFTALTAVCVNGTAPTLQTTSNNGINGTWTPGSFSTATAGTFNANFNPTSGTCPTTATISFTVNPLIVPTFTALTAVCEGEAAPTLQTTSNNGINGTWTPGSFSTVNSGTFNATFNPTSGVCPTTATISFTVNPSVDPTFTPLTAVCEGATAPPLLTPSLNNIAGSWSPSTLDATTSGTKTATYTPNPGQCANTATISLVVNAKSPSTFTQIPPQCGGGTPPVLVVPSNEGNNGTWTPAIVSVTNTATYTFTPTPGTCVQTAVMTIEVGPPDPADFDPIPGFCAGTTPAPLLLTTSKNGVDGTWNPSVVNVNATTTYVFTPEAGACATSTDMVIAVEAKVNPTFTTPAPYCVTDVIPALPTTSSDGIDGVWTPGITNTTTTYLFTPNAGECANTVNMTVTVNPATTPLFAAIAPFCANTTPPTLPGTSTNNIAGTWAPNTVNNTATGKYTFTPNPGTCAESVEIEIEVLPGITVTVPPATTCANVGVVLTASGADTYVWSPGAGLSATTGTSVTATFGTTTTVNVVGTTTGGCTGQTDVIVTIAGGLSISVNPSAPSICAGQTVTLTASGGTTYDWTPKTSMAPIAGNTASVDVTPAGTTTYTVSGNTNGCLGNTTVTVTVGPPAPATFDPINAFCTDGTPPSLPITSKEGFAGTWNPNVVNTTTTTTYTFTPDPTECANPGNLTITVKPTPVLGTITELCNGANTSYTVSVTLSGGSGSYVMTGQAPAGITGTFAGNVWTSNAIPNGAAYDFDFSDANGCGLIDVTGQKNCNCGTDVGTMGTTILQLCQGATATATYSSVGETRDANDVLEYVLHTNAGGTLGTIQARSATPTFTFAAPMVFGTTYYISAIVGDNDGTGSVLTTDPCLAVSVGQPVVWNATPVATASNNGPLCMNATLNLTGGVAIAGASYAWSGPNMYSSTQQSPSITNVTAAQAGTYSLIVTANGCPSTAANTTVVITPTPVATPASNSPICAGATLNLTEPVAGASYDWKGPNGFTATSQNPNIVSATTAYSGNYTLIVTVNGCPSALVNLPVVVNASPVVTINRPSATVCEGVSQTLTVNPTGATSYTWSPTTGLNPTTGSTLVATPTTTTTYTVDVVQNGCIGTATTTITVDPIPVVTTISDIFKCSGDQVVVPAFAMTPTGGNAATTGFVWSKDLNSNIGINGGPNGNINPFTGQFNNNQNVATITVKATRNGCTSPDENFDIIIRPLPTPIVGAVDSSICVGLPINLTSNIANGLSYSWTFGGAPIANTQAHTIPSAATTDAGTYTLNMTDQFGCNGTGSVPIVVNSPVNPIFTPMNEFCEDNSSPQALSDPFPVGLWSGPGVNQNNSTFVPSVAGEGSHVLNYQHFVGCTGAGTLTIVVNPMPDVNLTTTPPGCGPLSVDFTTDQNMQFTTIDFGNGTTSNVINGAITNIYNNSGFYDVTVTHTAKGCSTSKTFVDAVHVESDPVASFGVKEKLLYFTDPTVMIENNTTGAVSYAWDFGDNTTSTVDNPTHTYEERVSTYTIVLTATSAAGCTDETSQTIQVRDELLFFTPNTFTPDGDQYNNTFQPVFTSGFDPQNFTMFIYNRWGQIIFETRNAEIGWDGTYQGKMVQEGIYTWTMEVKDPNSDNKFNFDGHVFIVR